MTKRMGAGVRRALGVLRAFTLAMDQSGQWRFNIDVEAFNGIADSGDAETDIVELLAEVGTVAAEQGSGVALFLDELQFLGKGSLGRSQLRSTASVNRMRRCYSSVPVFRSFH